MTIITAKNVQSVEDGMERLNLKPPTDSSEQIDHPSHYQQHPSGIECIDIVRHENFNRGNAIKYLWRAGLKGGTLEEIITDLKKAAWYINDEIARLEKLKGES